MKRDWDNTYRTHGIVQREVLDTVSGSVPMLRSRGCNRVLDLCCGTGRHTIYLAQLGFDVVACDVSAAAVEITQRRATNLDLDGVSTLVCDMASVPLPDSSVDAVLCTWSLGHGFREDLSRAVAELCRLLRPGGVLLADFPSTSDSNFGSGVRVADKTFLHPFLDHPDVPHYYCDKKEVFDLLSPQIGDLVVDEVLYEDPKHSLRIASFWVRGIRVRGR